MTLEMATMVVINHTEEELDDDIVSNLSLNLMVSDNEDAGSPNSDRFDKLDSRDQSPDDSNNCDNTEEDMCMNSGLKDDLQQLRDITGDNCWSALDDADNNEISSDVDKEILIETGNKETTSLDTEEMDIEDNTGVTEENNSPCMEELNENKTTEEDDSPNNQYSTMVSTKGKEDEMENEERLLNDVRDNEKDTFDCENLDEDALLSDPRDEDLLQITEEKTTEKDAADFLKSCQEEQEADEFSSSSTEKAEDNLFESAGDYEESNTELLEPLLEPVDTVTNDNYDHSDIDNVMDDEVSPHLAKHGDEKREEDNGESNTLNGEVEDIHTENADVSMHSDNNLKENETNSIGCFNTTADIGEESGERIDSLEDESTFETSHEESYRFEQTESEKHIGNDTEQAILLNEADAPTKINATFDLSETALSETRNKKMDTLANDISSKAEIANDDTISDNIPYQDVNNDVDANTENITNEAEATNVDKISDNNPCEDAMKEVDTISENVCAEGEGSEVDVISGNMPDDSEVTNENEDLEHLPDERISPIECATEEDVSKEDYQKEIQTHKDVIMVDQVEKNEAPGIITNGNESALDDITEDKEELSSYDQEESALVDITNDNEKLEIEDDRTNNKQAQVVDSLTAVAVVADKPIEIDSEPMDVDDMEFEVAPIQSFIEKDASGISKSVDIVDSFGGTERTEESKSVTNNAQLGVEDNANIAVNEKYDCRNDVEFIHDDTKLNPSASTSDNIKNENIINLIDECEPEVITDAAQTAMLNVQHQTADTANIHDIEPTTNSLQSTFLHASKTVKPSGIEGDNKECEDMDIEEITPYKETATRPNGSVLMQILSTNSVPDTLSSSSPFASLPTTTDNNVVLVSPQPGEKRLSSDNFKTESSKRRKLVTPAVREIRQKYLESFKQAMASASWSRIGRRQLEEFATQKLLEAIHYKTEMGELHKKCMEYKQSLENLRTNSLTLTKQLRDMNSVHIKLEREINILKTRHRDDDKPLVAVKITRSVGLQALVEDPKVNRRGRPTNAAGAARTVTQNQPVPVLQKQQQLTQPPHPPQPSHPPQLQQKPMNQQKPVQVQVPQRVIVSTSTAPPLQARPVRSMATLPSGISPVQTRTMSRNKKIAAVSSTNPPPLRSLNQQQSTTTTNTLPAGSTISIPIKHITGPTILNKSIAVSIPTVTTPVITTPMTETSKAVIDLTDEDDVGKKLSPVKVNQPPQQQQQQQRITLMSTVVNGQQVLLRVDGGGPIPSKAATALTNGTPLFVQSPMQLQQRTATTNAVKVMTNIPPRTRTSSAVQTPIPNQQNSVLPPVITQSSPPNQARRFRHPAPLPTPPSSQNLIKGNKPIPPKPTVTVNKSPNGSGIIVKWNMPSMLSLFEKIVRYELFVYQVTKSPPRTDSWGKINDVGALDLPMAVSLTEFAEGNRYYFAVRAVDELGRLGPFSEPQTIVF